MHTPQTRIFVQLVFWKIFHAQADRGPDIAHRNSVESEMESQFRRPEDTSGYKTYCSEKRILNAQQHI
jgi:hypothetical protein